MLKSFISCTIAIVLTLASGVCADELENNFVNPPNSAQPRTWWHWVSGNVTADGITKDLEAMKRIGVGGAQCFTVDQIMDPKARGHVLYMSPEWQKLTQHAISECHRLGLELTITACEGWSETGGNWIKPEQSMQKVVWSAKEVSGPKKIATTLPAPETIRGFYEDIAIYAFPSLESDGGDAAKPQATSKASTKKVNRKAAKPPSAPGRIPDLAAKSGMESHVLSDSPPTTQVAADQVIAPDKMIDLTSNLDEKGELNWDVPAGNWTILRIGHTSTGVENHPTMTETRGLECDKLSRDAVKAFFDGALAKIAQQAGAMCGNGWNLVLTDSWEAGCLNWTEKFRTEFTKRRGYDPMKYMPAITGRYVDSPEKTERFLWDYRRTIADLIAENHYEYLNSLLHEHNVGLTAEAPGIGMPVVADELQCKGRTDIPMGEFWVGWQGNESVGDSKEAASAAHIYAKGIAGAEAFTSAPEHANWTNDPASLKKQGDRMFCFGINRFIFHRYAAQPDDRKPGITMGPWGINFERSNTWWEQGRAWISYLSRCEYLLQQGLFVGDLCYFYGEGAPRNLEPSRLDPQPPAGYDYDGCNTEVIMKRMTVRDGRIFLPDGMSYRALVLPKTDRMTPGLIMKLAELVNAGATVIGPKPVASPSLNDYPHCDEQVKQMAGELWGNLDGKNVTERAFGKGRIVWGKPLEQVLADTTPDFTVTSVPAGADVRYIHRKTWIGKDEADIYFVSNQEDGQRALDCSFRVSGKLPELWHADTGKIEPAPIYSFDGERTHVTLPLEENGSCFVVFRSGVVSPDNVVAVARNGHKLAIVPNSQGKLKIMSASYGVLKDPKRTVDVSAKVERMVKSDMLKVKANNELVIKDPAKDVHKQLEIKYELDGKPHEIVREEGSEVEIPAGPTMQTPMPAEVSSDGNHVKLIAWENGAYDVTFASTTLRKVYVDSVPGAVELSEPWMLSFPPKWGAPELLQVDKLISWSNSSDEGVRHFSGTGTYTTKFDLPKDDVSKSRRLVLDLGTVKNLAEVKLNGKDLGILWKPPFTVDITDVAKRGTNKLEVKITNLWPNRLIGDEALPPEKRFTWTPYHSYKADSPLLPSGLIGPVKVRCGEVVELR